MVSVQGKQHGWVATCSKTCPGEACSIFMLSCLTPLVFLGGVGMNLLFVLQEKNLISNGKRSTFPTSRSSWPHPPHQKNSGLCQLGSARETWMDGSTCAGKMWVQGGPLGWV